jgi:hypothetical protein
VTFRGNSGPARRAAPTADAQQACQPPRRTPIREPGTPGHPGRNAGGAPSAGTRIRRVRWRRQRGAPAGTAHVNPERQAVRGEAQRGAFGMVSSKGRTLVSTRRGTVGANHPPPRDRAAVCRHHPPDLAGATTTQVFGHIAVGHHVTRRYRVDRIEDVVGEVIERGPPRSVGPRSPVSHEPGARHPVPEAPRRRRLAAARH